MNAAKTGATTAPILYPTPPNFSATARACSAWALDNFPFSTCRSMALVDNSLICWRMAGWEKINAALNQLRTMNRIAGTSQLATDGAAVLTSLKTSPGAAKTFINRPASDIVDAGDAPVGGSGVVGMGSTVNQVLNITWEKSSRKTCVESRAEKMDHSRRPGSAGVSPACFAASLPHPLAAGTAALPGWQSSNSGSLIVG